MANNPYINKVNYGDQTLIDLTADTVEASKMLSGYTAHSASGATITGTIQSKTSSDISIVGTEVNVPTGYYLSVEKNIEGVQLDVPESDTHDFAKSCVSFSVIDMSIHKSADLRSVLRTGTVKNVYEMQETGNPYTRGLASATRQARSLCTMGPASSA